MIVKLEGVSDVMTKEGITSFGKQGDKAFKLGPEQVNEFKNSQEAAPTFELTLP